MAGAVTGTQLVVGAALVDRWPHPTRLLAARRSSGPLAGYWEFPGGKVEPGEPPTVALRRELAEELDLHEVTVEAEIGAPEGTWPITHGWRMRVWFVTTPTTVVQPGIAHDALWWVGPDRLATLNWLPADGPIVAAAARYLTTADG